MYACARACAQYSARDTTLNLQNAHTSAGSRPCRSRRPTKTAIGGGGGGSPRGRGGLLDINTNPSRVRATAPHCPAKPTSSIPRDSSHAPSLPLLDPHPVSRAFAPPPLSHSQPPHHHHRRRAGRSTTRWRSTRPTGTRCSSGTCTAPPWGTCTCSRSCCERVGGGVGWKEGGCGF